MRLLVLPESFDHEDFLFQLKWDGFRALAIVDDGTCELMLIPTLKGDPNDSPALGVRHGWPRSASVAV
jgi:hypothetical protein